MLIYIYIFVSAFAVEQASLSIASNFKVISFFMTDEIDEREREKKIG